MSAKHTPGTWALQQEPSQDHGQFSITGPDGDEIAAVAAWIGSDRPEAEANARLIAAAPDLLEALRAALPTLEALADDASNDIGAFIQEGGGSIPEHMTKAAREIGDIATAANAAVAKATGSQS